MLQAFAARQERSQRDQRTNPLLEQMNSFLQFVAAMIAAGSFGVAVTQTAMVEPLQQHSGTQSYVRMVR
jgi:uncharacterized membrane protein YqgA involved in biofilm formation